MKTHSFTGHDYTHTNSQDLYRVEIIIKRTATHQGCKPSAKAAVYQVRTVGFNCVGLKHNEL